MDCPGNPNLTADGTRLTGAEQTMSRVKAVLSIAVVATFLVVPMGFFLAAQGEGGVSTQILDGSQSVDPGAFYQGPGQSEGYEEPTAVGGLVRHTVTWRYAADAWYAGVLGINNRVATITLDVYVKDYIEALEADVPRAGELDKMGMLVDPEQSQVAAIASAIMSMESDAKPRINSALKFVQSLSYVDDFTAHGVEERWSLPAETLYAMGGDCEDMAFLFVSIVRAMGYDAVLVSVPGHLAAAVSAEGLSGDRYVFEGKEYYYCETSARGVTGLNLQGFKGNVGDMPESIRGAKAYLHRANPIS